MEENNKKTNKKSILDWVVSAALLISLVICYFFWGCDMDLWVTVLAAVLVFAGTVLLQVQNKKIKNADVQ